MAASSRVGVVTDGEKQVLLERYLDIVWLDDVSEFQCVRCHRVPIQHYLSNCQHLFCRNCRTVFSDGGQWKCPQCHTYVTQLSDQDWQLEERIYQIRAHCPNKRHGCPYQGQLSTISGHLRSCENTREAAFPAEFKGITLDTVVNQIERLNGIVDAIQSEVKALREQSESSRIETQTIATHAQVLTQDLNEQKEQLSQSTSILKEREARDAVEIQHLRSQVKEMETEAIETKANCEKLKISMDELSNDLLKKRADWADVKPLLKEIQDFQYKYETKWKKLTDNNDEFTKDLKLLRWDLHEQKEQLAIVKPILKDVNELKDHYKSNMDQTQKLENKVHEMTNNINVFVEDLNEQKERFVDVEQHITDVEKLKDRCEINWKLSEEMKIAVDDLTANGKVLTQDINEQKQHLANVEHLVQDVRKLKEKCENSWEQTKTHNDNVAIDLRLLRLDLNKQKKRLTNVKPILKDVQELKDNYKSNMDQTQTLENKVHKMTNNIKSFVQDFNEQKEQLANVEHFVKEVKEFKDESETKCKRTKKMVNRLTTNIQVLTQGLNEHKEHVSQVLDERETSGAVEMQQLRSQLGQQHTLMETKITQDSKLMTNVTDNIGEMQGALKDLKLTWATKWKDVEKQMDDFNKDQNGHKQRLVAINDKESQDALELQKLSSQLQRQQSLMEPQFQQMMKELLGFNKCEVHLNGMRMVMAETQMPHDQLHSMTLVYEWNIRDIKMKDGRWDDTRESEVFPLTGYHYGAKANIDTDGWIHLQLIDYNQTKRPIDTRSMPKITVVIVSQSHDTRDNQQLNCTQHRTHVIRMDFIGFNQSLEYGVDIYSGPSISEFTGPPYLVSNGLKLRLYIEPPSIARSFFSNDGILLWRMDNYKEREQMEEDGLTWWHDSPYFYTSPQGYRVLIRLSLSEKTVCGWLWFVKGEFDSSLTLQFPHRFTMTIFNHTDQSKNLVVIKEGKEAFYTNFKFETGSASLLESGGYVADDSVLIKAVVEPL